MSPRLSAYLDALRFSAAMLVVLSHFAYPRFTGGDYLILRELNLGSDAVIVFFVLSGFVISYAASERERTLGRYLFQRATRLYSVALPGVVLTLLCDRLGAVLAPAAYDDWWYNPAPGWLVLTHGLSFSNEWGPFGFRLGTNGPYWSLSYEAAYYVLFGIAVYLTGLRRILLLVLCGALFGVKVMLLAPAWLLGVAAYRALNEEIRLRRITVWALAVLPPVLYAALLSTGAPASLMALSLTFLGPEQVAALRFSNEFVWNGLIGVLFALHLFGVGTLTRGQSVAPRYGRLVRWLAGASFSIYIVHYPVLQLLGSVLPGAPTPVVGHLVLLAGTLAICFGFAQLFERPLPAIRHGVRRVFNKTEHLLRTSPSRG